MPIRKRHTAKERVIKTLFITSFILLLFQGCKPQPVETEFNALITPPSGDDQEFTTMEDQPVEVSYTPIGNDNSIELWSKISKRPRNGQLKDCVEGKDGQVTCLYVPNKDFNGQDSVVISQGDGKLVSDVAPVLTVKVLPINDAPVAQDYATGFSNSEQVIYEFQVPQALDPDSAAQDLEYKIISSGGAAMGECFKSNGDRRCSIKVENKAFEGSYELKYVVTDQENAASNEATISLDFSRKTNEAEVTFTQNEKKDAKGVDIVWVVDNSGSMRDEQENLKSNFQSFINNFLVDGKARFDFKMGVATTDEHDPSHGADGKLERDVSGNLIDLSASKAESDFSTFKSDFEKTVLVGTSGSGDEKALKSLDIIYQNEPGWFGGDDRLMVAIILTDEQDWSFSKDPLEWAAHFKSLKNDPNMVKIFPIVRLSQDNGDRYKRLAEATGGLRYSIDDPFTDVLNQISTTVATQLLSTFSINPAHEVSAIEVTVNGVVAKAGSEYTLENNNIVFVNPPEAGSEIKVRYSYKWK